jgi:hypothetical protein
METAQTTHLKSLIDLYNLHSKLFVNVIAGISEKDANNRMGTKANHPSWIAGSIVQQRYELARILGESREATFHELFKDYQGIKDNVAYPSLDAYQKDWQTISPILKKLLAEITEEKADSIFPMDMGGPATYYEAIYFLIHREAYCIGQIGLWRRLLGYEAMKYPD